MNRLITDNIGKIIFKNEEYNSSEIRKYIDYIKYCVLQNNISDNSIIGLALDRTPWLLASIIALLQLNITYLILDKRQPKERLNYMLENANVSYVIMSSGETNSFEFDNVKIITLCKEEYHVRKLDSYKEYVSDSAYILYTSGTTGKPKAVEVTRRGIFNFIEAMDKAIDFTDVKTVGCFANASFDIFFLESIYSLIRGFTVVLADEDEMDNPKKIIRLIASNKIDALQMTPTKMKLIQMVDNSLACLDDVKLVMLGGEAFPVTLLNIFNKKNNLKVFNMYGPTETTIWSAVSNLTGKDKANIGYPILNTQMYIVNDEHEQVEDGKVGEICIAGDGLAKGYLNNQLISEKVFIQAPWDSTLRLYCTGDIGYKDEEGYFYCLGRYDQQVKIHGHRIELDDIDANLLDLDQIDASVTCFDKERVKLITFYMANKTIDESIFYKYLKNKIPQYMFPNQFVQVDELIFNTNGKIDRNRMLDLYYSSISGDNDKLTIDNNSCSLKNEIIEIMREVLQADMAADKTNLDYLRFDSLSYICLIVKIEDKYNIVFDDDKLVIDSFETIDRLIDYIRLKIESH